MTNLTNKKNMELRLSLTRVEQWIDVKDLPEAEKIVFVFGINEMGKQRILRAYYAPDKTVEGMDDEFSDYDEERDKYFLPQGWYECNEFEETNWRVEFEVTHWMPLPQSPTGGKNELER